MIKFVKILSFGWTFNILFHKILKIQCAMMYDGTNWILTTKTELIDKIYESKKTFFEENFDEFCKLLSQHQKQSLERWLDTDEEDPKIAEIKESIKLLLYNVQSQCKRATIVYHA